MGQVQGNKLEEEKTSNVSSCKYGGDKVRKEDFICDLTTDQSTDSLVEGHPNPKKSKTKSGFDTTMYIKSERESGGATNPSSSSAINCRSRFALPSPTVVVVSDVPALTAERDQELTTTEAGSATERELGATIFIAPPEKWSEISDEDMEDGEISGSDEDGDNNNHGVPNHHSSCPRKPVGDKRWQPQKDGGGHSLKRRRLEAPGSANSSVKNTENPELYNLDNYCTSSASVGENKSRIGRYGGFNFDSASESSSDVSNSNEEQFIQQQGLRGSMIRDRNGREDEASDSLLLPLFRAVIGAERKKKVELEEENQKLKALLAKTSLEKEETFQVLRQSNKKLAEVTDASVQLEKKVEELNAQLAEKNVFIKNLKKETSTIRSVISRMNKSFEEVQFKESVSAPRAIDGKKVDDKTEKYGESSSRIKMNAPDRNVLLKDSKTVQVDHSAGVANSNSTTEKDQSHYTFMMNLNKATHISSADEAFILSKLKDLKKWAFSIKDIKRVDGKWKCPECGDSKLTALATAAHARDKHVWKCGAGLNPRFK